MRIAALCALLSTLLLAQDAPQPVPRFRSGVDIVLLDVTVLDASRRPARGLSAGDFTILEDGRPQAVVSFEEVDSPEPDGSLVPWMREVPPDVRTNADDGRRLMLIVLDDVNIGFRDRPQVKRIGERLIDQLGPGDQAAIIYTGNNARSQEFTGNRKLLRAAVARFSDTAVAGMGTQYAVSTIHRAVASLAAIPHRRKAMVLVSSLTIDMANSRSDIPFQVREAMRRAQRANVSIYPINPAGLEVDIDTPADASSPSLSTGPSGGRDLAAETARFIAEHTGGFAVVNRNEFAPQIQQIFRETGAYYLIGFQSAHRDGKSRRVQVRVNRPGLAARTRSSYDAPEDGKPSKSDVKALPLVKALGSVLPAPDVPLRVAVAPFAMPGKPTAAVTIVLGVQQPVRAGIERVLEKVELISTAYSVSHKLRGQFTQVAQLALRGGGDDAKYEVLSRLDLPPGRYNLRFAARVSSTNKAGSVFEEIDVPDFRKETVSLSGVVMGVSPSLPSAPQGFLGAIAPVTPTSQRVFMKGHRPVAYLRVYQGGKRARTAIALSTTIINEQDRSVHAATETLDGARFTGEAGVEHRFDLPIDSLAPGAYLLRIEAKGASQASASREVRFVVR
ncbi:MAG: VWA domain-containing protein [Acidobacteriota bacterium]|nr:VWA domain-containing protein [Acidobacteriota bacterium]